MKSIQFDDCRVKKKKMRKTMNRSLEILWGNIKRSKTSHFSPEGREKDGSRKTFQERITQNLLYVAKDIYL